MTTQKIQVGGGVMPQQIEKIKNFKFPTGEPHVIVDPNRGIYCDVEFDYLVDKDIFGFLLYCDTLKRTGYVIEKIFLPYVPFSRQDRINENGECFSLAFFANLINIVEADLVVICDPHSDVAPALIKNCIIQYQHEIFAPMLKDRKDFWLISPDSGALKKIYKLAAKVDCLGVIECSKNRDVKTGEITGTKVYTDGRPVAGKDCYIVDDICDGGRTFIEIAKELKKLSSGKVVLMVTHGFFTQGLEVFDGLIDEIYTRKGRIK